MGCKSICDKCKHRWSSGGKLYCTWGTNYPGCKYTSNKKACNYFEEGQNDKHWRGKDGSNRKGRCW